MSSFKLVTREGIIKTHWNDMHFMAVNNINTFHCLITCLSTALRLVWLDIYMRLNVFILTAYVVGNKVSKAPLFQKHLFKYFREYQYFHTASRTYKMNQWIIYHYQYFILLSISAIERRPSLWHMVSMADLECLHHKASDVSSQPLGQRDISGD